MDGGSVVDRAERPEDPASTVGRRAAADPDDQLADPCVDRRAEHLARAERGRGNRLAPRDVDS